MLWDGTVSTGFTGWKGEPGSRAAKLMAGDYLLFMRVWSLTVTELIARLRDDHLDWIQSFSRVKL